MVSSEMIQKHPFFSIIIPTYNRLERLANCFESLSHLDYPREQFEVIVIDDGSDMPLQPAVAPFLDQLNVTLLKQLHAGPARARNTGAERAKGEYLAFTDDDCLLAPNWLKNLAARLATLPDHAIGGRTLNGLPDNLYSMASQLLIHYLYTYYNSDPHQARFFTSNNLALPADYFHKIGGFNTTFFRAAAEDREFCERWLQHGYRLIYAPEVLVYHAHDLLFRPFWRQHFNYGRGAFRYHQLHARHKKQRLKIEPLSFYFNMLRYPLSQIHGTKVFSILLLLFISQGANASGFLWEMVRQIISKNKQTCSSSL